MCRRGHRGGNGREISDCTSVCVGVVGVVGGGGGGGGGSGSAGQSACFSGHTCPLWAEGVAVQPCPWSVGLCPVQGSPTQGNREGEGARVALGGRNRGDSVLWGG